MRIEAKEGFTFRRIHDGFIMGEIIYLGIDYSTGEPREDKAEYYEEVKDEYTINTESILLKTEE
jgi:hypothetical protein